VFLTETHWADQAVTAGAAASRTLRHERLHRVALTNRVLKHYRLKVSDWQGSAYLLSGPTGQTAVVPNLAAVWPVAEQMRKCSLDPLDPALIEALEHD
jgi:hypothetical protein